MKTITLELRAAEGGKDASLLVADMEKIYHKACLLYGYKAETTERKEGFVSI